MFQVNVVRKRKAQISLHSCACSSDLSLFILDKHYNQNYENFQVSKSCTKKQSSDKLALMRMIVWSLATLISDIYTKKTIMFYTCLTCNCCMKKKSSDKPALMHMLVWSFCSCISDIYTKIKTIMFYTCLTCKCCIKRESLYWLQSNSLKKAAFNIHAFLQFLSACLFLFFLSIIITKYCHFWDSSRTQNSILSYQGLRLSNLTLGLTALIFSEWILHKPKIATINMNNHKAVQKIDKHQSSR